MSRRGNGSELAEVKNLTLRRDTIVTVLALLVITVALPFAIVDTIETGRVYLFSRQFLEELPQRFTGPGRLRFILQPMVAIVWGFAEASPMPRQVIRPTCSACSSVLDVEENCCEAAWRLSATCSLWGSLWTSCFS